MPFNSMGLKKCKLGIGSEFMSLAYLPEACEGVQVSGSGLIDTLTSTLAEPTKSPCCVNTTTENKGGKFIIRNPTDF